MKKLMVGIIAAIMCMITTVGCKSIPTADKMYTTTYAGGATAGLIADQTKIDDTVRNEVIEIVNTVDSCIPATNETFTAAWTPIAKEHIQKLVDAGKIDAGQGVLIAKTFEIACNGIDYLINVRYPQARQYQELVESAAHGFCDGFLTTFKPANGTVSAAPVEIDHATYEYLSKKYLK